MRSTNKTHWAKDGWTIEEVQDNLNYLIVCNPYGWNDNPLLSNGVVYWDFPERIPQFVKDATLEIMTNRKGVQV